MTGIPEPTDLVEAAMAAVGASTDDELRDELRKRYGLAPAQGTINRWRNGKRSKGPSYEFTFALLDAAGWINRAEARRTAPEALADPQAKLAVAVHDVAKAQAATLKELRELRAEIAASRKPPQAPPKRSAG